MIDTLNLYSLNMNAALAARGISLPQTKAQAKGNQTLSAQTGEDYNASDATADKRHSRNFLRQQLQSADEARALGQMVPPRPSLTPSDEVQLYADASALGSKPGYASHLSANATSVSVGEAIAADGSSVAVDIIEPTDSADSATAEILNFNSRSQAKAAYLYARNNDAVLSDASAYAKLAA